jgi:hypothetical protein
MICTRCGNQNPDSSYFCSNCGTPNQSSASTQPPSTSPPPYQPPPQNFQQPVYAAPGSDMNYELTRAQKAIFIIGLVEFGILIFWKLFAFVMDLVGGEYSYERYNFIERPIELATTITVPLLCFLFAKKGTFKTILMIAFILTCLIALYDTFLREFVHHFFRHLF